MKNIVRIVFIFFSFVYIAPHLFPIFATTCPSTSSQGNTYTVTEDCTFNPQVPGIDAGTDEKNTAILDITSGALVIIDREIGLGSIKMTSGSLSVGTNGTIVLGKALFWLDADGDGYAVDPAIAGVNFLGGLNKVRKDSLISTTAYDCNDANPSMFANAACYVDADGDGFTVGGLCSICAAVTTCGSGYAAIQRSEDCNDADYSAINSCCSGSASGPNHAPGNLQDGIYSQFSSGIDQPYVSVLLSSDNGATYVTSSHGSMWTIGPNIPIYGGSTDLWGRTWSFNDFTNSNFVLKIETHGMEEYRNFSFSIPANAVISGITVSINGLASSGVAFHFPSFVGKVYAGPGAPPPPSMGSTVLIDQVLVTVHYICP